MPSPSSDLFYVPFPLDLGPVIYDGCEASVDETGTQRTDRSGVLLWRVFVWVRLPSEERRRVLPVSIAAATAPTAVPDTHISLVAPVVTMWRLRDGRCGVKLSADGVEQWKA